MTNLKSMLMDKIEELKSLRLILQEEKVKTNLVVTDENSSETIELENTVAINLIDREIATIEKVLETI